MTQAELDGWGWRIPFVLGLAVGAVGLFLRRHLADDRAERPAGSPLVEVARDHRPLLLWLAGISAFGAVTFYLMFVYVVSWLQRADGVAPAHALEINTACMSVMIPLILAVGWLSDRGYGRALMIAGVVLGLVGAWPFLWLMHHSSPAMIVLGQLGFVAMVGLFYGTLGGLMVEATPKQVRCSATALGYNITYGIAGGLSPLAATWLVSRTGDDLSPAWMIAAASAISLLALLSYRGRAAPVTPS
jgi:MHS family proline/betaine transporter-like MFS transporter